MSGSRLLTVPQVAERLQVSQESVRRWLRAKRLRGVMPGGTRMGWRISEQEVDRFLAAASGSNEGGPNST